MSQNQSINTLAKSIHEVMCEKGFWDNERNFGEALMLITSELGEALEAHRKHRIANVEKFLEKEKEATTYFENQDFIDGFEENIKDSVEDELADAVIRLLDLAAGMRIDLKFFIEQKMRYNTTRPYKHGKAY